MNGTVTIIGGGVMGRCTAYYAARRGFRVTLIDRHPPDHPGCSTGNAGYISPSHFVPLASPGVAALALRWMLSPESPFYVRPVPNPDLLGWGWRFLRSATQDHVRRSAPVLRDLTLASRDRFRELAAESGDAFSLVERGCLMLCATEHALEEERGVGEEGRRLGLRVEMLGPSDLRALEPALCINAAGAVHFLDDCHVTPHLFLSTLLERNRELGVRTLWGCEVTGFGQSGGRITAVKTTGGDVQGDQVVVTGGAWTSRLLRPLGVRLPLQAGKGYSLTLERPAVLPAHPMICVEGRLAVTPFAGALRFGGTMEVTGLDETVNPARIRGILKSVERYVPQFTPEVFSGVPHWVGLRPLSPDGLPYIGRVPPWENLLVGTGHAMMGVTLAPVTGTLLADLLAGAPSALPLAPLSPLRFSRPFPEIS